MNLEHNSSIGLLAHLNLEELKEILNDEEKFDTILRDVKQVKDWDAEKSMLIVSNRSLAEYNLSKEPELAELKSRVQEKSASGEELCKRIQELLEEYKRRSANVSPDTTHVLLQAAAAEAEEQSESIAQNFLSGEIEVDKFLEKFEPLRKKMHLRKFKAEKMEELLKSDNQNSYGNNSSKPYLPYPSFAPTIPSGAPNVPYPLGPLNMPMPGIYGNHF